MTEEILTLIGTMLSVLGGWEAIKYLINRKANKRKMTAEAEKAEAEADNAEFQVLRQTVEFLQTQLKEKEVRFAEQTDQVRKQNAEILQLTKEKGEIELELQRYRCVVQKCPRREPQNGY